MAEYNVGERLRSRVSTVQAVVVRSAGGDHELACGGALFARDGEDLVISAEDRPAGPAIEMGKRYEDVDGEVELLCVAAGTGELTLNGRPLSLKAPKPLPASD